MNLESVTFAAGLLNRAAHLRTQSQQMFLKPDAKVLPLWLGKPLVSDRGELMFLGPDHRFLQMVDTAPVFLGLDPLDAPVFAIDVSGLSMPTDQDIEQGLIDPSQQRHPEVKGAAFVDLKTVMTDLDPLEAEIGSTARGILGWHGSHGFCAKCGHKSDMAEGGWQSSCPACGTSHFPRTDPVVIMLITHGNSVLLGRSAHFPTGMYSLLAGFVEPGEPIEAAVRREVFEESGVRVGAVSYMASQPWPFPASLMIGCHGKALSRDITIDADEIEDAIWLSREDVLEVFAGTHPTILPVRKGAIAHFLLAMWLADHGK